MQERRHTSEYWEYSARSCKLERTIPRPNRASEVYESISKVLTLRYAQAVQALRDFRPNEAFGIVHLVCYYRKVSYEQLTSANFA